MSYTFNTAGWEDWDYNRHDGPPSTGDLDEVQGLFVHAEDEETGDEHWFWVWSYSPYEDWEQWDDLIESLMEMHGMTIA